MDTLYGQLAATLRAGIDTGVYRTGDRMPGVRVLAAQRSTSVATAVMAYRQLEREGYLEARERSGFYVRGRMAHAPEPGLSAPASRPAPVSGQELVLRLVKAANDPQVVQLGAAVPAPEFLPTRAVERALVEASRRHRTRAMNYAFPPGDPELRRLIARRMGEIGCTLHPDEIVITGGCQEAITLALRAVTQPGDVVAIESPSYYGLLQVIDSLGLEALEIPTHPREGLSLDALELALERWPVKACVAIPNFSNPLGYRMPDANRLRLLDLLRRSGVPLIEDDVYGDLGFDTQRPRPCKSLNPKAGADVLYCASFSKTLAPGLRVGWIAPGRHIERIEYLKFVGNLAVASVPQIAVAQLLASGQYDRYLRGVRGQYAAAVERMTAAVIRHFPDGIRVTRPEGGFVIWVELPAGTDSLLLARRALEAGVSIAPGPLFSATRKYRNFIRLSCACVWDARVERALAALARLL
ncbi:MAG: GntR family transcriptional regulator [Thiobacillus sp. SCN 64-35]|nr:PLP-dependent aminotransferase family protein [Thiobacillus sp.]ODU12869.1 MAG: GntR family transcriptional regulator [Thiobacillus sp. SCN 64-35]ODU89685.1 MAG: GntR family transcriptional regulator [Thiobacillus sp. SCN 65-179]OJW37613.1 MAG: GntR family transcriptional regulator [Thiobacillus sp. 65-69]